MTIPLKVLPNSIIKKIIMDKNLVQNSINGYQLMEALRDSGYDLPNAICDLIDNSFDAGAGDIWIYLTNKQDHVEVLIADNGRGMSMETLDQALRLGSERDRDLSELGKYGMGLITASISLARRLTVITREDKGQILCSSQDLDVIRERGELVKTLGLADGDTTEVFDEYLRAYKSGTLVILDKIDRISPSQLKIYKSQLEDSLGQMYSKYLSQGRRIFLDNKEIALYDPLYLQKGASVIADLNEVFTIKGHKILVGIKLCILPQEGYEKDRIPNMENQGFYFFRNNRQIDLPKNLGFFWKHQNYNLFRGEISFSGEADGFFGINYMKTKIQLDPSLHAALKKRLDPYLKQVKAILEHIATANEQNKNVELEQVGNELTELYVNNLNSDQEAPQIQIQNSYEDLGPEADLFFYHMEEGKVSLTFNTSHPFFEMSTSGLYDPGYPVMMLALAQISTDMHQLSSTKSSKTANQLAESRSKLSQELKRLSDLIT